MEESLNSRGRVLLTEAAAIIELAATANGKLSQPVLAEEFKLLLTLVGPANRQDFYDKAERLWALVGDGTLSSIFMRFAFEEKLKELKKLIKEEGFGEEYAASFILGADEEHWLNESELALAKHHLVQHEQLSSKLKAWTLEKGLDYVAEQISADKDKLLRKITTLDLTMSELRLLLLVLEVTAKYEVKPWVYEPKPTPPRTDFPLAG